jgi:pimeloyl-ACP methyl ester carboxylesterase
MRRSPNRTFRILLAILAGAMTLYVAFVFVMSLTFRALLYPAPVDLGGPQPAQAELRVLRAKDGKTVHALHFRTLGSQRTLVHFHGNGDTIRAMGGVASDLQRHGFDVVLVEYRGYGSSRDQGPPSEKGLYLDAEAALDALAAEGASAERVILWGTSLGTGIATEMATRGRGRALILVTPYTSIPAIVDRAAPGLLPARIIARDRFDNLGKAKSIRVPTLIAHGDADEVVPYDMGVELSRAIVGARLVAVPGARHGDVYVRGRLVDLIADWTP